MNRLNLLHDDIDDIAEAIKVKMISRARDSVWTVYARRDGMVAMENPDEYQLKTPLPDADMVGVYTRRVPIRNIIDDLVQRRSEINHGNAGQ